MIYKYHAVGTINIMPPQTNDKRLDKKMRIKNLLASGTAIMIVMTVVLILSSSTASAFLYNRTWTSTGGTLNYSGGFASGGDPDDEKADNILLVYNWKSGDESGGEKIKFFNLTKNDFASVTMEGPYTKSGNQYSGYDLEVDKVTADSEWDADGKKSDGYYKVMDNENSDNGGWLQVVKQTFDLELKKKKVQEGRSFDLAMKSNGRREGVMKLTIEDSDGYSIMNADRKDIYEILINYTEKNDFVGFAASQKPISGINFTADKKLAFNVSELDMEEGKYTIILEDYATNAAENDYITVEKRYLDVECDDKVVKRKDIVLTVTSSFYEEQATVTVADISPENGTYTVTLDEEGKKKVKIPTTNLDYGTYKITVIVSDLHETKYVKILKEGSSLEVPDNATVGDIVHITGSSDFGDLAVFVIDDIFKGEARISDDKFDWDWDTSGELDGYREIEVFVVNAHDFSIGATISEEWRRDNGVDASAGIFLLLPMFSMTVPEDIAEGDDMVISGEAIGADHIYILVINYKGEVMFPPNGIARATPVEEGRWEEKISDLDNGKYVVISLDKGRDERTTAIENGKWAAGGESKTLEQRVAILEDKMDSAGSDDMFEVAYFKISTPHVSLEVPETVEINDELPVKAETNIKDGEKAFVSLSYSSNITKTTYTLVEDRGVYTLFDTRELRPGTYNVRVDVSGRAFDEKEVLLVEKKELESPGEEESITTNESLSEPETSEPVNESVAEMNESQGEGEKIPINFWNVLISIVIAASISIVTKRKRHTHFYEL